MWKKKEEKKEEEEGEKDESLLKELCGDDAELSDFLSNYLLLDPLAGVPKKDLAVLTEEAEKSGDFRPAVDKAIFEAAQNPGERERYINVIQNLASKSIYATEQEKEKAEKEGLSDRALSLGRRIEVQKFMSERAADIVYTAAKFYGEILVELGENVRREERGVKRSVAEAQEWKTAQLEKEAREVRKKERRGMGREEKREAEIQDKRKNLAAEEMREAKGEEKREAEREEKRIGELEKEGREVRKKERRGK
jgi:hypothetical protein